MPTFGTISPFLHLLFQTHRWWASIFLRRWKWSLSAFASLLLRESSSDVSIGPSSHIPSFGMQHPRPILGGGSSLTISSSIMLCSTQQDTKMCWQILICGCLNPLSRHFHLLFNIPKQHSTSFLILSMLVEKQDSRGVLPSDRLNGQINVGHWR